MPFSLPLRAILLASLGSVAAALLVGRFGLGGTIVGAALVPVVIILVSEMGGAPVERLARAMCGARGRPGVTPDTPAPSATPAPGPAVRPAWERLAAGSALAIALVAAAVAIADGTLVERPAERPTVVRQIERTTRVEVPVPAALGPTVTVVERVEVPTPVPAATARPAPATSAQDPTGGVASAPDGRAEAPAEPAPPVGETDVAEGDEAMPAPAAPRATEPAATAP